MRVIVSQYLREIAAGIVLELDDPEHAQNGVGKKVVEPTKSITIQKQRTDGRKTDETKIPVKKAIPDEVSKDIKVTKRPGIKPPRRISDFKAKWKGMGSRKVRNDYQAQYRREHGNGYVKKIKTASGPQ